MKTNIMTDGILDTQTNYIHVVMRTLQVCYGYSGPTRGMMSILSLGPCVTYMWQGQTSDKNLMVQCHRQ